MDMSSQGNFDSLDLAEFAKKQSWWHKLFGQELDMSLDGGWVSCFRMLGSWLQWLWEEDFCLVQLANHTGSIQVDWQQAKKDMKKDKK